MTLKSLFRKYKSAPEFIYEGLKYDLSEQLREIMEIKGLTKKELAERMGVSPSYITKIFGADNISLKTVAKVLAALEVDAKLCLKIEGMSIPVVASDRKPVLEELSPNKSGACS